MRAASEATRQIVEFEELVSRLDRINDLHGSGGKNSAASVGVVATGSAPSLRRPLNAPTVSSYNSSPVRSSPYARQDAPLSFPRTCRDDSRRVKVNIGIDEDLRMILEMDPSIVDRQLPMQPSSLSSTSQSVTSPTAQSTKMVNNNSWEASGATALAALPQGWYWHTRKINTVVTKQ